MRDTPFKWLDLVTLFDNPLSIQCGIAHVDSIRFFTAPALARFALHGQDSVEAQHRYHRALEQRYLDRISIVLGAHSVDAGGTLLPAYQKGVPFDRRVRIRVWKIEEKRTDVNLATVLSLASWHAALMTLQTRRNLFDTATSLQLPASDLFDQHGKSV